LFSKTWLSQTSGDQRKNLHVFITVVHHKGRNMLISIDGGLNKFSLSVNTFVFQKIYFNCHSFLIFSVLYWFHLLLINNKDNLTLCFLNPAALPFFVHYTNCLLLPANKTKKKKKIIQIQKIFFMFPFTTSDSPFGPINLATYLVT
jgi:hypothetical protein